MSVVDRTDPILKRAAAFVIAYPMVDVIFALAFPAAACANCTPQQIAWHKAILLSGFTGDLVLVVCAYFGSRGRTWGFIAPLVILCLRLGLAFWSADYVMTLVDVFFAYGAVLGIARCLDLNRRAAIRAAIRQLASNETEEPPPPWTVKGEAPPTP